MKKKKALANSRNKRSNSTPIWFAYSEILTKYFEKNIAQVTIIFWLSVLAIIIGFGFIIWGFVVVIQNKQDILQGVVALMPGIITEFIGATFFFIYKSSIQQASQYLLTLERIFSKFGMAEYFLNMAPEEFRTKEEYLTTITQIAKQSVENPVASAEK